MNLSRFDSLFEEYLGDIVLTRGQADGIDQKIEETLSLFVGAYEGDVEIYSQGSYAMGTTVRPLTAQQSPSGDAGEYDVDMVLERTSWQDATGSLESVRNVLSDEYSDKLDRKLRETCERVLHSTHQETDVSFHVDYVPIKYVQAGRYAARRSTNEWFSSDTKQLIEWFDNIADEQVFLPATILILKRMRDTAGLTDTLSSICITALVCALYKNKLSYAADLLDMINGAIDVFDVPHSELTIRIMPLVDDLAGKIDATQQRTILNFFKEAKKSLLEGFTDEDLTKLRTVLSSSFPANIADFPEYLEPLRRRGWGIETDGSLRKVFITEHEAKGTVMSKRWLKFIGTGERLEFRASPYDRQEYGIRWQVLNAANSPQVRGDLFEAHAVGGHKNSNEFINHETEQYDGTHWIKYYVYSKMTKRVVEIGERFFVEVNN
jgi:hypothetical protein